LPAIEREAVVIQTPRYVQAGPASSLASQLPQVLHRPWGHCQSCGSRTCRRSSAKRSQSRRRVMCKQGWPHRWQASSHRSCTDPGSTAKPVGAGLAGDRARSGRNTDDALCASRAGLIAGKPAPTGLAPPLSALPILWEPDLPAIEREAVAIQTMRYVQAGLASSLASQLPQVLHRPWEHCQSCGSRTCRRSSAKRS